MKVFLNTLGHFLTIVCMLLSLSRSVATRRANAVQKARASETQITQEIPN